MIAVKWDNSQQTIIRLDYAAPVADWDEYDNAVEECYKMVAETPHPVAIIHNAGDTAMPQRQPYSAFTVSRRADASKCLYGNRSHRLKCVCADGCFACT